MKLFATLTFCWLLLLCCPLNSMAQTVLEADGSANAYTVINNVLAPGATAVESPDQTTGGSAVGSHANFGRHIQMVFDAELNKYVFQFLIHINSVLDNDVSTGDLDRQRVEIKTYGSSPANLKGTVGENITYKWRFRLPIGFQPSSNFTHIHQIKAVDGDDSNPLFTITPRYNVSGNTLQLIYTKDSSSGTITYKSIPLSSFLGVWVEVTEQLTVGANGTYNISIKRLSDAVELLAYSNNNILTIRPSNTFTRPKWGIYRSITSSSLLRDDSLRIASISITENQPLPVTIKSFTGAVSNNAALLNWQVTNEINFKQYEVECSNNATANDFKTIGIVAANQLATYSFIHTTIINPKNYYRLKLVNNDGSFAYSNIISVIAKENLQVSVYTNPAKGLVVIATTAVLSNSFVIMYDGIGKMVKKIVLTNTVTNITTSQLQSGLYRLQLIENNQVITNQSFIIAK